jgi:vacuolar protein sorting-associated protein 13A/C
LDASIEGFRLVLIGDIHELPLVHFESKAFELSAMDWTGEVSIPLTTSHLDYVHRVHQLSASATLCASVTYWNLTNSHWEPVIEPWVFSLLVGQFIKNSDDL